MLRPTSQFGCCGCGFDLVTGVKLVLSSHLMLCFFCCAIAIGDIVLKVPSFGYVVSSAAEIYTAAWSLAGIPIIIVAIAGVNYRMEGNVRLYLYYLLATTLVDIGFFINILMTQDACTHLQPIVAAGGGRALACGIARSFSVVGFTIVVCVQLYCLYAVWSYCEDLAAGGSAAMIADLLYGRDDAFKARAMRGARMLSATEEGYTGGAYGAGHDVAYGGYGGVYGHSGRC